MEALLSVLMAFAGIVLITAIVLYVLSSLGYYYVLKVMGSNYAWAGWIPFVNEIMLASLDRNEDGNCKIFGFTIPNIALALYPVYSFVLSFIPVIGTFLAFLCSLVGAGTVLSYVYAEMENKDTKDTTAIAYISGLLGIVRIVKFLIYKYREVKPYKEDK